MKFCKSFLVCFLIIASCLFSVCIAQPITGVWKGKVNNKRVEVKLVQKGDSITGTSYYPGLLKGYRRYSVKGYFDGNNNSIVWWDDQLLFPKERDNQNDRPFFSADYNCPGGSRMFLTSDPLKKQNSTVDLTKVTGSSFRDEWDFVINNYQYGANDPQIIDSIGRIAFTPTPQPTIVTPQPAIAATQPKINTPKPVETKSEPPQPKPQPLALLDRKEVEKQKPAENTPEVKKPAEVKPNETKPEPVQIKPQPLVLLDRKETAKAVPAESITEDKNLAEVKQVEKKSEPVQIKPQPLVLLDRKETEKLNPAENVPGDNKQTEVKPVETKPEPAQPKPQPLVFLDRKELQNQKPVDIKPEEIKQLENKPIENKVVAKEPTLLIKKEAPLAKIKEPDLPPPLPTNEEKFNTRKKEFAMEVPVSGDSIEIRFYDNAEVDGDSISLFLNDKLIFEHIRLTSYAYTIKLPVKELQAINELVMLAENLGSIPPNTAYMVIMVGNKKYDAQIVSTETSSALIRLRKE